MKSWVTCSWTSASWSSEVLPLKIFKASQEKHFLIASATCEICNRKTKPLVKSANPIQSSTTQRYRTKHRSLHRCSEEVVFSYLICSLLCMMDGWQTTSDDENEVDCCVCFCRAADCVFMCVNGVRVYPADAELPWYLLVTCFWLVNNFTIHRRHPMRLQGVWSVHRFLGFLGGVGRAPGFTSWPDESNVILVYRGLILTVVSLTLSLTHSCNHRTLFWLTTKNYQQTSSSSKKEH